MKREFLSIRNESGTAISDRFHAGCAGSSTVSIESPMISISYLAKSPIKFGDIDIGEICVMDSTNRERNHGDDNMLVGHLSGVISEMLASRREMFLKTTGLMKDILHDTRTPLMALELSSSQLSRQLEKSSLQRGKANSDIVAASELSVRSFINTIFASTSLLKANLEEYALLQQSYLVNCQSELKFAETDLVALIQDAYNQVVDNYFLRKLIIREEDFNNILVYSHPEALSLLVFITLTQLLRIWRKVIVRVHRVYVSTRESIATLPPKDTNYTDVEMCFECEEKLLTLTPASFGKDYVVSEATGVLLRALNATVHRGNISYLPGKNHNNYVHLYIIHCRFKSVDPSDVLSTSDTPRSEIGSPGCGKNIV